MKKTMFNALFLLLSVISAPSLISAMETNSIKIDPKVCSNCFRALSIYGVGPTMPDPDDKWAVGTEREKVYRRSSSPTSPTNATSPTPMECENEDAKKKLAVHPTCPAPQAHIQANKSALISYTFGSFKSR